MGTFLGPIGYAYVSSHRERVVNIINKTGNVIYVKCASGDKTVADKYLAADDTVTWKFSPNFLLSTVYWCNVTWRAKYKRFDAWKKSRAGWNEDDITWTVRETGIKSDQDEVEEWM